VAKIKHAFLALLFLVILLPGKALAARFLLSPSQNSVKNGDHFSVTILMDTKGVAVNAAEATLSYSARYLQVESISTAGSVFKFWSQDPAFSNTTANINFGGGLPSPGVVSSNAKVLTINFVAAGLGTGTLHFENGAILANDGVGTNVLTDSDNGSYQVSNNPNKPQQPQPQPQPDQTQDQNVNPSAPQIVSRTHPDEDTWYNVNTFEASWNLPVGVDGVSYVLVNSASYTSAPVNKGLINSTSYDLTKFNDGVWYFYVQFHTSSGWGDKAKRKVKIDRTPPGAFSVLRTDSGDPTNPRPSFSWNAKDDASGVLKYLVKIGDGDWFDSQTIALQNGDYTLPLQAPGTRSLTVRAVDYAGNNIEASVPFTVSPIPGPTILSYPKTYNSSDRRFVVQGEALTGQKILLTLASGNRSINFDVVIAAQGDTPSKAAWTAEYDSGIPSGNWKLTAISQDSRGAESDPTGPLDVQVNGILSRFGPFLLEYGATIAFAMLLLGVLIALGYFIYHSFLLWKIRLKGDLRRLQQELKDDLKELNMELAPLLESKNKKQKSSPALKRSKARVKGRVNKIEKDLEGEIDHLGVS
jgi:hypothetical protein